MASLTLKLPSCFSEQQLAALSPEEKSELYNLLRRREALIAHNKLLTYYPDSGPLRRELYPKHLEFFRAGREHRERGFFAANRIGKTEGVGGFECSLRLTGRYPEWWEGRRFDHPISAWAAGDTSRPRATSSSRSFVKQLEVGLTSFYAMVAPELDEQMKGKP